MGKRALVFLAPGAEEIEFTVSVDVLRRGGVHVDVAGLADKQAVTCSRGVVIVPDTSLEEINSTSYDAMVLPGGLGGSKAMAESSKIGELLKCQEESGKIIAAICAAPTALKEHGIGKGKSLTSYPSTETAMTDGGIYNYKCDNVVVDGNLITSRGPGTAYEFALAVLTALTNESTSKKVAEGMLVK